MLDMGQGRARGSQASEAAPADVSPAAPATLASEVRALFREARNRRRRRRLTGLAALLLAGILAASAALTWVHHGLGQHAVGGARAPRIGGPVRRGCRGGRRRPPAHWRDRPGWSAQPARGWRGQRGERASRRGGAAGVLGRSGRRLRAVAGALVAGRHGLNLATRQVAVAGAGQTIFLSADRHYLLMSQTPTSLAEMPVAGGRPRVFNLPSGLVPPRRRWPRGSGGRSGPGYGERHPRPVQGVAGRECATDRGLEPADRSGRSHRPGARGDRCLHAARRALQPARVASRRLPLPGGCMLNLTDTASGAVTTVRSPSAGGFAVGGAFSPDGSRLAVFVNGPSGARRGSPSSIRRPAGFALPARPCCRSASITAGPAGSRMAARLLAGTADWRLPR